jgi:hypothetical protein
LKQQTDPASSHIPWHPAFFQAIKLELEQYKDALEFISEYPLNAEPLKIDVVIIKKAPDIVIEKNIARIFKQTNILEYKSPEDYLSVWDFYKVFGYAGLYAALNKTSMKDMTISLIGTRYPKALLSYFTDGNHAITETSPGIYVISGYPLDVQVIESKKLLFEENLWLKGLSDDLNVTAAGVILEESHKRKGVAELSAYIYALLSANTRTIEEVLEMVKKKPTLEEVLIKSGLTAEWEKRGEAIGEARGKAIGEARGKAIGEARGKAIGESQGKKTGWEEVIKLLKQGYTVDQLERMSPGDTAS